ncbi:MAG: BtpA/SgcQ family protein [bacterium]|nr:BtpA/SgcQ family protein [bacterium]
MPWFEAPTPAFIGVVHLPPTPGSPRYEMDGGVDALLAAAVRDARALRAGGVDAVIVENFGDAPFFKDAVPAETVATLALALRAVRDEVGEVPVGINVLRNDARAALGLCAAAGADFLRVNVHVGAAATDQGIVEGRASETLRERQRLCPEAALLADVHVKHATPMSREPITRVARDTLARGLADAVIVSGAATGDAPDVATLREVREAVGSARVLIGSGLGLDAEAARFLEIADGAIVGTALKRDGRVEEAVDVDRVRAMRAQFDRALRP